METNQLKKENRGKMPEIKLDVKELIYQSPSPQIVDKQGRISVGRKLAGMEIIAYVVEV